MSVFEAVVQEAQGVFPAKTVGQAVKISLEFSAVVGKQGEDEQDQRQSVQEPGSYFRFFPVL